MLTNRQKRLLNGTYYDLRKEGGYASVKKLVQATNIKEKLVKEWLVKQPTYTLHRQIKRKFKTRRYVVMGIGEQHQADLVEMIPYAKENNGFRYILTIIDIFSKKACAIEVKNKTGPMVAESLQKCWRKLGRPKRLQTDKGKEFHNAYVKNLGVEVFSINSKANVVERFNRTIKEKMWKWFTKNNNHKWRKILPQIVNTYNNTVHRTIKMKPNEVTKKNEMKVWRIQYRKLKKAKNIKYKPGTYVRISKIKRTFEKGYLPNWTSEVFVVDTVNIKYDPPLYYLKDLTGESIEGGFYEQELQQVHYDPQQLWEIEKIIKRKPNEMLVKWRGYPDYQWIPRNRLVIF